MGFLTLNFKQIKLKFIKNTPSKTKVFFQHHLLDFDCVSARCRRCRSSNWDRDNPTKWAHLPHLSLVSDRWGWCRLEHYKR